MLWSLKFLLFDYLQYFLSFYGTMFGRHGGPIYPNSYLRDKSKIKSVTEGSEKDTEESKFVIEKSIISPALTGR